MTWLEPSDNFATPGKGHSPDNRPDGLYIAEITRYVHPSIWVTIPRLTRDAEWGPLPVIGRNWSIKADPASTKNGVLPGQQVAVAFMYGNQDFPIVLGKILASSDPELTTITTLTTAASASISASGAPSGYAPTDNNLDLVQWAKDLLGRLTVSGSLGNIVAIVAWAKEEGGHFNGATWNPLNTTQSEPGYTAGPNGIGHYLTYEQGMQATVTTLTNGLYAGILGALQADQGAQAVCQAVIASPWGTGPALLTVISAVYDQVNTATADGG